MQLAATGHPVVVLEYKHVAMRLCTHVPTPRELADGVAAVMARLQLPGGCIIGHSYGEACLRQMQLHHLTKCTYNS